MQIYIINIHIDENSWIFDNLAGDKPLYSRFPKLEVIKNDMHGRLTNIMYPERVNHSTLLGERSQSRNYSRTVEIMEFSSAPNSELIVYYKN